MLDILYHDDHLIAINKPCGLLVHRTYLAEETEHFAMQQLRDQIGQFVYPIHRIDRPTSGVLLFALSSETARHCCELFEKKEVTKSYYALLRGWLTGEELLDYPVKTEPGTKRVEAQTFYRALAHTEIPIPVGPHKTTRLTLASAQPHTGRWHQIRQHFGHLRHYIINDRRHGDNKQNRMFREELNLPLLFLHARELSLQHPETGVPLTITAPWPEHWQTIFSDFQWNSLVEEKNAPFSLP